MRITKKQALQAFKDSVLPAVDQQYSKTDSIARREAWSNYTDELCKNGQITLKQYESWTNPF